MADRAITALDTVTPAAGDLAVVADVSDANASRNITLGSILTALGGLITTLGTIVTGVWNGTAIATGYGGLGADNSAATGVPVFAAGAVTVTATSGTGNIARVSYVDAAVVGLLDYKGATDCSASPNYPAALKGDAYVVSVAGKIGGASGTSVEAGDWYVAEADNAGGTEASVGSSWGHIEHNLVGALVSGGPLGTPASGNAANLLALPPGGLTFAATKRVAGRNTAAGGVGEEVTASLLLDWLGTAADGDAIVRTGGAWALVPKATDGNVWTLTSGVGAWAAASGGATDVSIQHFRLTTETGVAVSTADRTAQSTIYLTPCVGNQIALYDGSTTWTIRSTAEISLVLSGLTSGKNYDMFAYWSGSAVVLELSAAWTNDTTRADALTTQDGVRVKSGATTRRYVGTIRTTSTTTTEDSGGGTTTSVGGKRFVWNLDNRVSRFLAVKDTTDSWTYTTATFRQARATAGNMVEFVVGIALDGVTVVAQGANTNTSTYSANPGIGDGNATNIANTFGGGSGASVGVATSVARYSGILAAGYHAIWWLEVSQAVGTTTWYGDGGVAYVQAGMTAEVRG